MKPNRATSSDELGFVFKEREALEKLYLGNFKPDGSLFGIPWNWSALEDKRCPLCNNRLKLKPPVYFCSSKKHPQKQSFAITEKRLLELR